MAFAEPHHLEPALASLLSKGRANSFLASEIGKRPEIDVFDPFLDGRGVRWRSVIVAGQSGLRVSLVVSGQWQLKCDDLLTVAQVNAVTIE